MNWINYELGIIVTAILWLQAILVFGSSLFIAVVYLFNKDYRIRHIIAVALSHAIFTGLSVTALLNGIFPLLSIRGGFIFLAYLLTNAGLIELYLKSRALRRSKQAIIAQPDNQ